MAENEKEAKEEKKGGGKLILILVAVLVLVLVGAGAFFFLSGGPSDEEIAREIAEEGKAAPAAPEPSPLIGVLFELDPFVVNLADPKARHFLKATITLELTSDKAKERAEKLLPKVRNDIILLLSSQTLEDVITMEGKIRLRDEIAARVARIIGEGAVRNVYFAQFVVQ